MGQHVGTITLFGSIIALVLRLHGRRRYEFSEGNSLMKKISASIHQGAMAYLRRSTEF